MNIKLKKHINENVKFSRFKLNRFQMGEHIFVIKSRIFHKNLLDSKDINLVFQLLPMVHRNIEKLSFSKNSKKLNKIERFNSYYHDFIKSETKKLRANF